VGQVAVLTLLALFIGKRKYLAEDVMRAYLADLERLPDVVSRVLEQSDHIRKCVERHVGRNNWLFLGRGYNYPVALEGALKLKEISYIHAEGYAAGELKHGPIALVDETMPVIVIAPYDRVFDKTVSNMQEVAARGGRLILITDAKGAAAADGQSPVTLTLPTVPAAVGPLVCAVPVQLLAYHTAVALGTDVDQPRNLAKSVTVE